jgi:hypothetical protein
MFYRTRLFDAPFEYEMPFVKGWKPQADALAVSTCVSLPPATDA